MPTRSSRNHVGQAWTSAASSQTSSYPTDPRRCYARVSAVLTRSWDLTAPQPWRWCFTSWRPMQPNTGPSRLRQVAFELWSSQEEGGRCLLRWTEIGGPPIKPPRHQGFGMRVIEQIVYQQ